MDRLCEANLYSQGHDTINDESVNSTTIGSTGP
jgi:hypothetical protein